MLDIESFGDVGGILTESLELVTFGHSGFVVVERWCYLVAIDHNSIVVYFAKAVSLLQVVPTNLIVEWDVVALAQAWNSHINVVDSCIIVDKYDVIVEHKDVEYEHSKLNKEGHEEANKSWRLRLFIVIVQLEEVSIQILIRHIDDTNQKEVQACGHTIPCNEFAHTNREATYELLRQVTCHDKEQEQDCIRCGAHNDNS